VRNLAALFPGAGGWVGPSLIRDDITMVEHFFRASIGQDLRFKFDTQTVGTGAGGTVSLQHPEPPAGFFHLPVNWSTMYDGAAAITVRAQLIATASPPDTWGTWVTGTQDLQAVAGRASKFVKMSALPYMRATQLQATFVATAAAANVQSNLFVIELPAELCTIELWASYANFSSVIHTQAL
jgi:hypothetical protein